jgi:hypothetical protein
VPRQAGEQRRGLKTLCGALILSGRDLFLDNIRYLVLAVCPHR